MNYYPVIIPTLCRYEHFKRCVESLSRNTHADKTELVIGLDYPPSEKYREGYEKIKAYIPQIKGFKKITTFYHKNNLGAVGNWKYCESYCFENYDAYIGSEDDNEFSPCFLDFMDKALERYKDDEKIESIGGWSPDFFSGQNKYWGYQFYASNAWGSGRWTVKEEVMKKDLEGYSFIIKQLLNWKFFFKTLFYCPKRINNNLNMLNEHADWGDVKRGMYLQTKEMTQIRPSLSLVRNHGNDGTGVNCKVDNTFEHQRISNNEVFIFNGDLATVKSEMVEQYRKEKEFPGILYSIGMITIIFIKYLLFRIKVLFGNY